MYAKVSPSFSQVIMQAMQVLLAIRQEVLLMEGTTVKPAPGRPRDEGTQNGALGTAREPAAVPDVGSI
jgi:hypothetical protein